jgi:rod shape-determining protein MreC
MMEFLNRHKRLFLLLGMVVCITAIVFTVNPSIRPGFIEKALSYTVVPVQRGVTAAGRWVAEKFSGFSDTVKLVDENKQLRDEINRLRVDNQRLDLLDEENKRLSALLAVQQKYEELPMRGAEIIGKDPMEWYDSYNIDLGANDGLTRNMAILGDGGGLLGVVRDVYPLTSKVISIIDSRCSVAVSCTRTGDNGILKGDTRLMQQGLCRMEYLHAEAQVMAGDEIVTSTLSNYYPPGVLVGTVLRVESNPDGLTKYAIVQPAAKTDDIETVLVVTKLYGDENAVNDEPAFIED